MYSRCLLKVWLILNLRIGHFYELEFWNWEKKLQCFLSLSKVYTFTIPFAQISLPWGKRRDQIYWHRKYKFRQPKAMGDEYVNEWNVWTTHRISYETLSRLFGEFRTTLGIFVSPEYSKVLLGETKLCLEVNFAGNWIQRVEIHSSWVSKWFFRSAEIRGRKIIEPLWILVHLQVHSTHI